ncbi:MAG TPA: phage tail protein [Marinilabiliales bacterium]|jgi:Na+-transporting methylmalonyl-CoA/oxaloacetate decarboxylase gamma subunit|nr:MAG: hypothetical protein A2W95_14110 [Bacteroidetes bacterium GWA2_40_14]OFX56628.1 MAG: hypothetical protein A2W84_07520 [Bacteroidetes bacterium GWC2_40_13]OFX71807.1 MAG: hypothetical protein A2W96_06135 [Bacteroidetes bacterium GWD2_40_43]OFX94604.1 MAG: hypothetical protein A2W97_17940 [Bacteroidetes bacterium GWE2_40_63]OFY22432.1 MAG: hypothetical protein A2W88_07800 [Bacteroidetes bacterium GWF2_40_13]OFZ24371.1 MAG: hypothetical protein A2437_18070 [Bacteroidetes bacterium RIFOXYC
MRNSINRIIAGIALVWLGGSLNHLQAQSALDLRINEFLVYNDSNYVDDFGEHNPWIEIYNSAYNTVNIGGCYLTNDLNNPTMYYIPKGQNVTKIPQQGYLVFYADGHETRGIQHLNFSLEESKLIALFESNGKTLIDSITIPKGQKVDVTFGRIEDGSVVWDFLEKATPVANNQTKIKITSAEIIGQMDPTGIGMAVIAMTIVFSGLLLLYLFFKYMAKVWMRDRKKSKSITPDLLQVETETDEISGEVNAAIALALYLYRVQLHDTEAAVLTISKVSKTYSPWSSKIYGLRKNPR